MFDHTRVIEAARARGVEVTSVQGDTLDNLFVTPLLSPELLASLRADVQAEPDCAAVKQRKTAAATLVAFKRKPTNQRTGPDELEAVLRAIVQQLGV